MWAPSQTMPLPHEQRKRCAVVARIGPRTWPCRITLISIGWRRSYFATVTEPPSSYFLNDNNIIRAYSSCPQRFEHWTMIKEGTSPQKRRDSMGRMVNYADVLFFGLCRGCKDRSS